MPLKTAKELDEEIERARKEIVDFQKRIRQMAERRKKVAALEKAKMLGNKLPR